MKIFGRELIDEKAILQLERCLQSNEDIGVLTADAHYGYGHPIGGVVGYKDKISLSGVGFDIGCGNYAVRTDIRADDLDMKKIMDEVERKISFGVGRKNKKRIDHPIIDEIAQSEFAPQRKLADLAYEQLGTVGSGNHFVDIFRDEEGFVWIGVHFGSRGFGHKTTTGFIAMAQGLTFEDHGKEGAMDSPPILFDASSQIGEDYFYAMEMAGEYAYAGREAVVEDVLRILDNPHVTFQVHNHHNFAWKERHFGEDYYVVRKGATPAFPGQYGFIGATMRDTSVIVIGKDSEESKNALYSTVHGAGRIMSRNEAAGKRKWVRDEHGVKRHTVVKEGKVNFNETKREMDKHKIELRGAGADESPQCYKNLEEVLACQGDTIEVLYRLQPIGVAMAGNETFDPYKD